MKIVETVSGSITSTKQFLGGEERDGSGNVTKQFFSRGQRNGSTNYFFGRDHLGSIRTMTDNSGVSVSERTFDPFGRMTLLSESIAPDLGFAGMYVHSRSALNLTPGRPYSPALGRWITRDPSGEGGGVNLFGYASNSPSNLTDPTGLQAAPVPFPLSSTFIDPILGNPAIPGQYNVPPTLQPDVWEPVTEITDPEGFKKCVDDVYKRLANICFKAPADKSSWIKAELDKCRKRFGKLTGEWKEIHGGDAPWYAKYNPQEKTWEFYRKA